MKKLAVIFPGIGYHADKPLLYYARKLATEAGYEEQIKIEYTSTPKKIRGDMDKMKKAFEELYAQAECALKDVRWEEYDDVLFISKSIGTVIAMTYAGRNITEITATHTGNASDTNTGKDSQFNLKQLLYTPLEVTFAPDITSNTAPKNAIAFIGTADPWSNVPEVIALSKENNIPIHVYDDANHSLETDETIENLHILRDVMKKSKIFMN